MGSLCYLLDVEPCRCSNYAVRQELLPSCIVLSPERLEFLGQMPETCSYLSKPISWQDLIDLINKITFSGDRKI